MNLIDKVNKIFESLSLPPYYDDPLPHVSIAYCELNLKTEFRSFETKSKCLNCQVEKQNENIDDFDLYSNFIDENDIDSDDEDDDSNFQQCCSFKKTVFQEQMFKCSLKLPCEALIMEIAERQKVAKFDLH